MPTGGDRIKRLGGIFAVLALIVGLVAVPSAGAALGPLYGGAAPCVAQPANGNVRLCSGTTTTWDGTKIDVDVILPPLAAGADGPYPTIGDFHGWGGEKIGVNAQTQGWAERGYAVFSMSDRGWGKSCGGADLEKLLPVCAHGYNHLMDDRYEVRDAQYLIGELADEGVAQPQRIGATGASYGGGISMALAALRDRTMLPDGSLVPWTSPGGKAMKLAAAVPQWPWTDLAYALMPNGRTLDYVADSPYRGPLGNAPTGIEKASFVTGLFGTGLATSNYSATDTEAALPTWYSRIDAGEPYDGDPLAESILQQIVDLPLLLLPEPRRAAGAAADPERLERRPFPARRSAALLRADPHPVSRRPGLPLLHGRRPPAQPEQGSRRRPSSTRASMPGSTTT